MDRHRFRAGVLSVAVAILFAGFATEQSLMGVAAQFDAEQMHKDIEVMKSILATRLSFAGGEARDRDDIERPEWIVLPDLDSSGRPRVEGFYLYDQGAVFTVSLRGLTHRRVVDIDALEARLERAAEVASENPERLAMQLALIEQRLAESEMERAYEAQELATLEFELAGMPPEPPLPPEPPQSPEPMPAPGAPRQRSEDRERRAEEMKQKAAEIEKRVQELRTLEREETEKVEQYRARVTDELITALANHGDSLSGLKADEYINLILIEGEGSGFHWGRTRTSRPTGIFSAKKSDITQYRLGQITLDQFKSRVLTYE